MYKCPFKFIFGISCPGCGMTRAFLALITLNLKDAFYYHPLFPVVIIWAIAYLLYRKKLIHPSKKCIDLFLTITVILFFVTYFIRLRFCPDIVSINPKDSLIYKLFYLPYSL